MRQLPLACMVDMDDVIDGVCCLMSSDDVRTMLICGPSGTGKSVAARGVSRLFPGKRQVEVPVNVTVESLYGSVDLEVAIDTGGCVRSDSIFSRADGGVIVVDNANLMDEGTLFAIVETVSEGVARAEVGGLSSDYICDSRLICTMNPDEGAIPQHIMDRFDICVFTGNTDSEASRRHVMALNLTNDVDPDSVDRLASGREDMIRSRVESARSRTPRVPEDYPEMISRICSEMHVEGHRGDVAVLNVALALTALDGSDVAGMEHLRKAVRMCLEHRRRDESKEPEPLNRRWSRNSPMTVIPMTVTMIVGRIRNSNPPVTAGRSPAHLMIRSRVTNRTQILHRKMTEGRMRMTEVPSPNASSPSASHSM